MGVLYARVGAAWVPISGSPVPSAWIALPLNNPWTTVSNLQVPQYRKFGDDVQLRGFVSAPNASNFNVAQLPVGCRPPAGLIYVTWASWNGAAGRAGIRVDVTTDGTISVGGAYSVPTVSGNPAPTSFDHVTLDYRFSVTP